MWRSCWPSVGSSSRTRRCASGAGSSARSMRMGYAAGDPGQATSGILTRCSSRLTAQRIPCGAPSIRTGTCALSWSNVGVTSRRQGRSPDGYVRRQTTPGGAARYRRLPPLTRSVRMVAAVHHPVALLNAATGGRRALRDVATTVLMLPRLGGARGEHRSGRSRGVRCPPRGHLLARRNRPTLTVPPTSGRARWAGGHKRRPSSTIL